MDRNSRIVPEKTFNRYRSEARVDRDRILYCPHLARLAEVTQVRTFRGGFLVHNRLTHSLKVAQLARHMAEAVQQRQPRLAKSLEIDCDVAEAAGLAHDLGHPPFGHVAEQELDALVNCGDKKDEGYEGNAQSFRILVSLTSSDTAPDDPNKLLPGVNATKATLNAVLKYPWLHRENPTKPHKWGAYKTEADVFAQVREGHAKQRRSPEAEIMDWADDITYAIHDLVDFYCAGLIPLHLLTNAEGSGELGKRERELFFNEVCNRRSEISGKRDLFENALRTALDFVNIDSAYTGSLAQNRELSYSSSILMSKYVEAIDLIDPSQHDGRCAEIKQFAVDQTTILKELTWHYVIKRSDLATIQHGQRKIIREVFEVLHDAIVSGKLELFPIGFAQLIEEDPRVHARRWSADYISGLTERQILDLHKRLVGTG